MTYGWSKHHIMNEIAKGKALADRMDSIIVNHNTVYPAGSYFMNFTSNHDENSWNGTEFERMGDGAKTFGVMAATIPGMFLLYTGQEVALDRRLKFFDKDSVVWLDNRNFTQFYTTLIQLKADNPALWNGSYGGDYKRIDTQHEKIYAYSRTLGDNKVLVILNLSSDAHEAVLNTDSGKYKNVFTGKKQKLKAGKKITVPAWGYVVLTQ